MLTLHLVDLKRVAAMLFDLTMLINIPFELAFGGYFAYRVLGISAIVGLASTLVLVPLITLVSRRFARTNERLMATRDQRMGLLNECFLGIRMIKSQAWERRFGAADAGAIVVQFLDRGGAFGGEGLGTGEAAPGRVQFGLALGDLGPGGGDIALAQDHLGFGSGGAVFGLLASGLGLGALGIEGIELHPRQRLAGGHEVAFAHEDVLDAARQLGGHVDLGGLDAAVATDETFARPAVEQTVPGPPGQQCHDDDDGRRDQGRHGADDQAERDPERGQHQGRERDLCHRVQLRHHQRLHLDRLVEQP